MRRKSYARKSTRRGKRRSTRRTRRGAMSKRLSRSPGKVGYRL